MSPAKHLAADRVLARLVEQILDGTYGIGAMLPSESALASEHGVSRLTVREAVKILRVQQVVRVEQGRGTLVNPVAAWTPLDASLLAAKSRHTMGAPAMASKLLEVRRLVEPGAAALVAARRTDDDLVALEAIQATMRAAVVDVEAVTRADLAFHRRLLDATGNPFVTVLFEPLDELLYESRRQTKAFPELCEHALYAHGQILAAVRDRDPERARRAMQDHLEQTETHLSELLSSGPEDGVERFLTGPALHAEGSS